ncbi:MAG: tetratricopeptide repeat protein, partial [Bacteroidota bacterium]
LFTVISLGIGFAQPNAPLFDQANKAYENKAYAEAIQLYESILAQQMFSASLYYNLGNSYYRSNELGKAILNYERALRLHPSDADIQHNLKVAKRQLVDDFGEIDAFFLNRWWSGVANRLSSTVWATLGLLLLWLAVGGAITWLLAQQRGQRKRGFLIGTGMLILGLLSFLLANSRYDNEQDSEMAIVMKQQIVVRAAPDADSAPILEMHEGSKVRLLDQLGKWYKVRLTNGEQGWLSEDSLEKV